MISLWRLEPRKADVYLFGFDCWRTVTISTLADDMTKSDEKGLEGAGNVSIGPTTDAEDGEEGMDMSVMTRAEGEGDNDGNDGACKAVSEINFTDTKVHEDEQLGLLADAE